MALGIQICGLNGCGKSTLAKALSDELHAHYIDNEYLYFSRTAEDDPYESPRSQEEVERLLMEEVLAHPDFVFAAVRGDYGKDVIPLYDYVVMIDVPKEIRAQRIRNRSFQKFGERMLPGGDLFEQEQAFFQMVSDRDDEYVESWLATLTCPVIRVDGTAPVAESLRQILAQIGR